MIKIAEQLKDWIPIRVQWQQTEPFIDWCYFGQRMFTEPFFDQTVDENLRYPFNRLFRQLTPIDVLEQFQRIRPGLLPNGFIFHSSRCGSTLVSQMLAALSKNIVVSEAAVLDWIIRAKVRRPNITDDEHIAWLQWMVSALAQRRIDEARYFFIKFDSWNTFDLDFIERAFPNVPWIFLYRHPLEVMMSQLRLRGAFTLPCALEHQLPELSLTNILQMSSEEYMTKVLAYICKSALQKRQSHNALFVNYQQLPQFVTSKLLHHFRVNYSDEDIEKMSAVTQFHAKNPKLKFANDASQNQCEANETIRQLCDNWLMPLYEELETVRCTSLNDSMILT